MVLVSVIAGFVLAIYRIEGKLQFLQKEEPTVTT